MLFLATSFLWSQNVYDCATLTNEQSLHKYASYIDTAENSYTINQIIQSFEKLNPKKLDTENDDLSFTNHYFWVKFEIENTTASNKTFYIETARPITDIANLYLVNQKNGIIQKQKNGDVLPYDEKSFYDRKILFEIHLASKTKCICFLQLKSDGEVLKIPLMARTAQNLMQLTSKEQLLFGIFYGILAIAAIIYLFFYVALREQTLLLYSLYALFIGAMQFALDGYFHQYISPNGNWLSQHAVLIFALIATFLLGKYCEVFLKVKTYLPIVYKLFLIVYVLTGILLLMYIFVPKAGLYCYPTANVLGLCMLLLIIISIITLYAQKVKIDVFFSVGILFLILGFIIFILNNFGQVSNTFFTQNSSKFGTGFEIIFLSLSMSNFIRNLKNEKNELVKSELVKSLEIIELKSYFLSNISHELRTPLNAVINLNEESSKITDNQKIEKNCEIINYSSLGLLGSVNDILDFSKIQKNQLILTDKPFDVADLFQKLVPTLSTQAQDKKLKFDFELNNHIQNLVVGDEMRLQQIFTNIINNSLKFTTSGFINCKINLDKTTDSEIQVSIKIVDSGIGIEAEKKLQIFDSFSQNNISNKRKFGGLGLGLYIVKTLVDMQQGVLEMESEVGVGTTFTVRLTYKIGAPLSSRMNLQTDVDLKNAKILYVEDNKMNQMVLKMFEKKWQNVTIDYVENGLECLSILEKNKYDIILMDLQMPIMDGYEATQEIRAGNSGINKKDIPIIAITADVMEATKQTVFEIGMNAYLTKPINKELLFESISSLILK